MHNFPHEICTAGCSGAPPARSSTSDWAVRLPTSAVRLRAPTGARARGASPLAAAATARRRASAAAPRARGGGPHARRARVREAGGSAEASLRRTRDPRSRAVAARGVGGRWHSPAAETDLPGHLPRAPGPRHPDRFRKTRRRVSEDPFLKGRPTRGDAKPGPLSRPLGIPSRFAPAAISPPGLRALAPRQMFQARTPRNVDGRATGLIADLLFSFGE